MARAKSDLDSLLLKKVCSEDFSPPKSLILHCCYFLAFVDELEGIKAHTYWQFILLSHRSNAAISMRRLNCREQVMVYVEGHVSEGCGHVFASIVFHLCRKYKKWLRDITTQ